ncbi:MAG: thiamine diphosphokinase [Oscillospiraceae bacterium]|nr:thiamine diphosphokinase [Oscillospiraceae bacterium]
MAKCIIFCAGGFTGLLSPIEKEDFIIAADGGLKHTEKLGITPNAVIGDFDSLGYTPQDATIFPVEKDDTDSVLAIRKALSLGYRELLLYGALDGPRLDHTLANLQTLQFLADRGGVGYLVGEKYIATTLKNSALTFPKEAAGILSVFCMGQDAQGVTLTGLKYPLTDGVLSAGFPLGVSNHFIGEKATISVNNGSLLLLYNRENGLPKREDAL